VVASPLTIFAFVFLLAGGEAQRGIFVGGRRCTSNAEHYRRPSCRLEPCARAARNFAPFGSVAGKAIPMSGGGMQEGVLL